MPSERILNKLFEIAQENTSEEVNYNDFVKDLLNSADLTLEDKTYNAEDEYFKNLLALAKHDSRIFGEYRNGKFIISESVIKSAKKETQRQIDVRRKVDNLEQTEGEKNKYSSSIDEMLKSFEKLDLGDRLELIDHIDEMSAEECESFFKKISEYSKELYDKGIISSEDYEKGKEIEDVFYGLKAGNEFEKSILVLYDEIKSGNTDKIAVVQELLKGNPQISNNIIKLLSKIDELKKDIEEYISLEQNNKSQKNYLSEEEIKKRNELLKSYSKGPSYFTVEQKYNTSFSHFLIYETLREYVKSGNIEKASEEFARITENKSNNEREIFDMLIEANFEGFQELLEKNKISISKYQKEDTKLLKKIMVGEKDISEISLNYLENKSKKYQRNVTLPISETILMETPKAEETLKKYFKDKNLEEKKATEEPGLEGLTTFDDGFVDLGLPANGDFMSAFGEFGDASLVTDKEFDEKFDIIEIGNASTEKPRNADIVLEEEPEMDGENETRPSVIVEKINSDAVTLEPKQEETKPAKLSLDSVLKQSEKAKKRKVAFYFSKVKELAHAEIDINKINQIDDIA